MNTRPAPVLRPMREDDIAGVLAVQSLAYGPGFLEDEATIRARWQAAPHTAWVAVDELQVCAYLVAYPSRLGKVTLLHGGFDVPAQADCLYLHDLAVSPRAAGRGLAPALLQVAWQAAARLGLGWSALVSVQGSQGFWLRYGYAEPAGLDAAQRERLASYPGGAASYMLRRLDLPGAAPHLL